MRTFKNVIGKIIGMALLSCITISAFGQTSNKVDLNQNRDDYKFRLYSSPLNLINPAGNSFQLTAGKSLWKGGEVQLSVSQRLGNGNPYLHYSLLGLGLFGVDASFEKGTRVGLEAQQVIRRRKNYDIYIGIEGAYEKDHIIIESAYVLGLIIEDAYHITRTRVFANMKLGYKFFINENFVIDAYAGLGMRKSNADIDNEFADLGLQSLRRYFPLNVKFGYQF